MASKTARRTDPELWSKVKRKITAGSKGGKPGQWSARKAQLAVLEYKRLGGGYVGKKTADLGLVKWTRQKWRTKSGRPSLETGERYLPAAALGALSPAEYAATTRAKRLAMSKGRQFSSQPQKVRAKTAVYRRNGPLGLLMQAVIVAGIFAVARRGWLALRQRRTA